LQKGGVVYCGPCDHNCGRKRIQGFFFPPLVPIVQIVWRLELGAPGPGFDLSAFGFLISRWLLR